MREKEFFFYFSLAVKHTNLNSSVQQCADRADHLHTVYEAFIIIIKDSHLLALLSSNTLVQSRVNVTFLSGLYSWQVFFFVFMFTWRFSNLGSGSEMDLLVQLIWLIQRISQYWFTFTTGNVFQIVSSELFTLFTLFTQYLPKNISNMPDLPNKTLPKYTKIASISFCGQFLIN